LDFNTRSKQNVKSYFLSIGYERDLEKEEKSKVYKFIQSCLKFFDKDMTKIEIFINKMISHFHRMMEKDIN